jgi:hypothetical protein
MAKILKFLGSDTVRMIRANYLIGNGPQWVRRHAGGKDDVCYPMQDTTVKHWADGKGVYCTRELKWM